MINEEHGNRELEQKTDRDEASIEQNSSNIHPSKNLTASIADQRESKSDPKNESMDESSGPQRLRTVFDPSAENFSVKEIKDIVQTIAKAVFRIIDNNFDQLANRSSNILGMRVKDSLILKVQQTHKKQIPFDESKASLVCRLIVDDDLQFRFLPRTQSPALSSDSENLSTRQKKSVSLAEEVKVFNRVESEFFSDNEVGFLNELTDNRSDKIMDQQRDADSDEKVYDFSSQKSFTHMDSESSFDPNDRSPYELLNNKLENFQTKILDHKTQKTNKRSKTANKNIVESSVYAEEQMEHADSISTEKPLISNVDVEMKFKEEQSMEQSPGLNAIDVPNAEEVLRQKKIGSDDNAKESIECLNIVDNTVSEKSNEEREKTKQMEELVNEFFRNHEKTTGDKLSKTASQPALESNDEDRISEKETLGDNFTTLVSEAQFNFMRSTELDEKLNNGQISKEKKELEILSTRNLIVKDGGTSNEIVLDLPKTSPVQKYGNGNTNVKDVTTCRASQNNLDGTGKKIETNQRYDTVNENKNHETHSHNSQSEDNLEPNSKHAITVKKDQSLARNVSSANQLEIEATESKGIVANYEKQSTLFSRMMRSQNGREKNIVARETALDDDTSRINDQLSADSRRLNSLWNPEIDLEDAAKISLTYGASEADKGQRKNVRTHPEIKSRQEEELTLSDEKLKVNLTFGTKAGSATNFLSSEKTPWKVSLKARGLLKKSSRTDGSVDRQSANDPSSQQPLSKVCRKPSQSSRKLSKTVINEAISLGANRSPAEISIVSSQDVKLSDKDDTDASKNEFELIKKYEIEKRTRESLQRIQAQVYSGASENISQLDPISAEQTVVDVEVSQERNLSNEIDEGEMITNRSRCSLLGEKSSAKLKCNKQEITEREDLGNERDPENLGNEPMTRQKSTLKVVSKSSIEGSAANEDALRQEIDRRITESKSSKSFFELKDSESRNKSQDSSSIATQFHAAPVYSNGKKLDQFSASSVNNKDRNRFVDLMKQDKDNRGLFSNIKSIFKSPNKSELQKRSIANVEDQEKDIAKEQSVHLIEENAEIPIIQSMKSLQDDRKRSKNRKRHGHKLFDDESTSFATKDFAQNSYQADTQSDFMHRENYEQKVKDFGVDDGRNSFEESFPPSHLQILLTDEESVEDKTAEASDRTKRSKKKQNSDGNMRKFAISLSRIFRNSSRNRIGVKESRATVNSQTSPEDHFVIAKVPLSSSDDSSGQANDCKIAKPKSKTTGLDNREEVVAVESLDSSNDLDNHDANRESIVKRPSTVLQSRYATNHEATNAKFLRQEQSGTVIFSALIDVNRILSENELAKEDSLNNFQQMRKSPEKICTTKSTIVSYAPIVESAKYLSNECEDPYNEDHRPEDHQKRSSGKSFAKIRKLFSRASIKTSDDKDRDEELNRYSETRTSLSNSRTKIRQSKDIKNIEGIGIRKEVLLVDNVALSRSESTEKQRQESDSEDLKNDLIPATMESDKADILENKSESNHGDLKPEEISERIVVGQVLIQPSSHVDLDHSSDLTQKSSQRLSNTKKGSLLSMAKSYIRKHFEIEKNDKEGERFHAGKNSHDGDLLPPFMEDVEETSRGHGVPKTESGFSRSLRKLFKKRSSVVDSAAPNHRVEDPTDDLCQSINMQTLLQSRANDRSDVRIEPETRDSRENGETRTSDEIQFAVYNANYGIKCLANCEAKLRKSEHKHDDVEASKSKSTVSSLGKATRKSIDTFSMVGSKNNKCLSIKSKSTNEDTEIESSAAHLIPETHMSIGFTTQNNPESKTHVIRDENVTQNRSRSKTASRDVRLNPSFVSRRSTIVMMATPMPPRIEYQNDNSNSSNDSRDESSTSPTAFYYLLGPSLDEALVDVRILFQNLIDKITGRGR